MLKNGISFNLAILVKNNSLIKEINKNSNSNQKWQTILIFDTLTSAVGAGAYIFLSSEIEMNSETDPFCNYNFCYTW